MAMLNTTDMSVIRSYIDWIFDQKIIPGKIKIRSIGFLTTPGFGNEFNQYRAKKEKIIKSTELPARYRKVADDLDLPVATYGDLAFIKMALEQSPDSDARAPYKILFHDLIALGFEPTILNTL